ncbi:DMT family transporter [Alteromonas ponticola]|uniref:EamA family transporter n=1 Tax=Alteromonas ponticola TaxID=2720613 RepID=A0ABX1R521_9ALTE|nr:EamA family transporter [Alteromonas ponticola]NMH60567.1 EamA family transporter [Alteromonas ponticola]
MSCVCSGIKGALAIVAASILWGTTGTAATFAADVNPLAIGAFAMGIAGILMSFSAFASLRDDAINMLERPYLVVFGSVCVALYPLAFYSSMWWSGIAIGTVISLASAPFFAALLERLICKKSISPQWWVCFFVGATGMTLLSLGKIPDTHDTNIGSRGAWGVLLGLVAGLTYAGYSWAARELINHGVQAKSSLAGIFGGAAILLLPSLFFTGDNLFASKVSTYVLIYMAVIPMFLGYLLFGYGLKSMHASDATLLTLIEPVVATLLAIYLLGEAFNVVGWIGMVMISLCLILQSIPQRKALSTPLTNTRKRWSVSD